MLNVHDSGPVSLPGDLRSVLGDVADTWTREIRQRTRSGRAADGRQMRRKADGTRATLHDTGRMLASLQADVDDSGFRLHPTGQRNTIVARTHQRTGRRFMGASEQQIDAARDRVAAALRERDRR